MNDSPLTLKRCDVGHGRLIIVTLGGKHPPQCNFTMIEDPDYPNIILSFPYRGYSIELDRNMEQGQEIYTVWVTYSQGFAVAVPCALTRKEAIRKAKRWIDERLQ